ncbi:MAG: serine hydrolase domain-containing protein [Desulfobacterales bacterium]
MMVPIHGYCDAAFERVRDVFEANFSSQDELGAACAVYVDGTKVVDLWGGHTDPDRSEAWQEDTLVGFYSVGKPLAALCALQLIDSGDLELDLPVCRWWPEFSANGKAKVTLRQLLCHQGGLPAVRKRLPEGAMLDWQLMVQALAEETPWYPPGSRHIYHTNTYGFLVGELVCRISGKTFGDYFDEKISGPLAADVFFGLSAADLPRVARIVWHPSGDAPDPDILDKPMDEAERLVAHSYFNPSGFSSLGVMNTPEWRMATIPSTNGHGTARGIAKIYHILAQGGAFGKNRLISKDLLAQATQVQSEGPCPVLQRDVSFGLGFQITRPDRRFGPNSRSFGHFGTGGSLGFADPDARLGFGYVMNDIIPRWQNPRNRALVDAVYHCI